MKIYLAASWPRRDEARHIATRLKAVGHTLTADWWNDEDISGGYANGVATMPSERAARDLQAVRDADAVVCLTGDTLTKGGRHSEVGAALALGKRVFLIGPKEQVFHQHPLVSDTVEELCS